MLLKIKGNPYIAGTGNEPPHLAGREMEKSVIDFALDEITGKPNKRGRLDGVSPPLVLIGPRGVGKTVMLEWSIRRAEELGIHTAIIDEEILAGPEAELGEAILGVKEYKKAAKEVTTSGQVGHPAVSFIGVGGQKKHPTAVLSLRSLLTRKLEKKPLLVILDEAHAVAPELLKPFCVTTQRFMQASRPLAMVMAGTPGLRAYLRGIAATFMEHSKFIPLNLLAPGEAREALSRPAFDTGVPMDEDALGTLSEWTDGYPFFIQMAGEFVWDIAKGRGASQITMEDATQALEIAGPMRRDFYDERYQELDKREVVPYALQVIDLIEGQPGGKIGYQGLIDGIQDANKDMEHKKVVEMYEALMKLGFIFKRDEGFEAGIPSLFDYVKEQKNLKR